MSLAALCRFDIHLMKCSKNVAERILVAILFAVGT